MARVFVIRNQDQHYLSIDGTWVDGSEPPALFCTRYRDVAINELFEANLSDINLRGELLACRTCDAGHAQVEVLNPIAAEEHETVPALAEIA